MEVMRLKIFIKLLQGIVKLPLKVRSSGLRLVRVYLSASMRPRVVQKIGLSLLRECLHNIPVARVGACNFR